MKEKYGTAVTKILLHLVRVSAPIVKTFGIHRTKPQDTERHSRPTRLDEKVTANKPIADNSLPAFLLS